jgi:LPXTG-motif cell wall-anchored protein
MAAFTPGPASAQGATFPGTAAFSGYSVGAIEHLDLINSGSTRVVNVDAPLSTSAFNSQGLGGGILSETGATVAPAKVSTKNSYASTGAVQAGLGTDPTQFANQNQLILSKLLEASAAPSTDLVKDSLVEVPGDPLAYALAAYERAAANWSPDSCILGQPISFGENAAAKVELLNTGGPPTLGQPSSKPLIAVNTGNPDAARTANFTRSYNYLFPNGDGTFGVGSITRMVVAPVTLFANTPNQFSIEVAGPIALRVEASGKPGGAKVSYLPETNGNAPVVTIHPPGGAAAQTLGLNDILGKTGLPPIDIGPPGGPFLAQIRVANPAHAIGDDTKPAVESADGTQASAASDIVKIKLLNVPGQFLGGDLRVAHMEAKSVVPAGGVECPIPVSKTATPDPVTAGQDFTWTISIPSSIDAFKGIDCDLLNIKATDTARVVSGSPTANITSVSNGGSPQTGTVSTGKTFTTSWANLGNYKKGDPPIQVTIKGHIPTNSGAGVLENVVNVSASLGNCKGGAAGQDLIGNAAVNGRASTLNGGAVVGAAKVSGPNVKAAAVAPQRLAETGQKQPWLPVAGGGLLLGALALMRSRRRLHAADKA